jgi:acetyltransferase-like isoleucine patch superfamily enzyme
MKLFLHLFLMFFPWWLRRRLLCWLFKYKIDKTARIKFSIIMPKQLEMGPRTKIGSFCLCKNIDRLVMKEDSGMGSFHLITGIPTSNKIHYQHIKDRKCEMVLGKCVGIPSRKFFDCNGGIYIGDYTTVAGQWTQFLTHSLDIYNSRQNAKPIIIGKYCFIGTGCILMPGSSLPNHSVLGAGAVLNKTMTEEWMIYAGVPAIPKKKIDPSNVPWMQRLTRSVK